jgi:aspartyl-tRNA(Asn)/glutamyl-tRNA(Gln) amidotransferase subunit A
VHRIEGRTHLLSRHSVRARPASDVGLPTSPTPAFRIGERQNDPLSMYMADVYTLPASLAGIAGISVPCGQVSVADGGDSSPELPVGVQLLCPAFQEERLFTAAASVEGLVKGV